MAHTDRIWSEELLVSFDIKVGDMVIYIPNGLEFRIDNKRQLKWMQESKLYCKKIQ